MPPRDQSTYIILQNPRKSKVEEKKKQLFSELLMCYPNNFEPLLFYLIYLKRHP